MIVPTSKMALKTSCLRACNNDIDKAERLYEFYAKDIADLPDFDIMPPNTFQQAKDMISNTLSWIDNNQDKIVGYYNIFQHMRGGQPLTLPTNPAPIRTDIPPIPNE